MDKQQLLTQITALNSADKPFQYGLEGDKIVGLWKIADVNWASFTGLENEKKDYKIIVTLNEAAKTYSYTEVMNTSSSGVSVDPGDGSVGFGTSGSTFSGKTFGKGLSFGVGQDNQTGEVGIVGYKYALENIRKPLLDTLSQAGWTPEKKGFFSKLLGK